jgi:coenzyme F420-reducing hydrogenase gamma subunit
MNTKPIIGIFGLTSCAGDQLAILNCEDELVRLANAFDIKDWEMAQTNNDRQAHSRDLEALKEIRKRSKILVALGTCAIGGWRCSYEKSDTPRNFEKRSLRGRNKCCRFT